MKGLMVSSIICYMVVARMHSVHGKGFVCMVYELMDFYKHVYS